MCGIAGIANFASGAPVEPEVLLAMAGRLAHRGPDGEGVWGAGCVGLAHRRLAVIDLSDDARQPMTGEDGQVHLVANGEIYNHKALRAELESRGHRFRSRSDSEAALHAYEEWGLDFAARLEGFFALAIYDMREERLVLARDRLGVAPLYIADVGGDLIFASELKAILAEGRLDLEIDDGALDAYLAYLCVPESRAIWRGARKLPPGHLFVATRGRSEQRPYWTPPPGGGRRPPGETNAISFRDAVKETGRLLDAAVARRIESDVPLGVFLSGGVDSALVAESAARALGGSLRTFTAGFAESGYDERPRARLVAGRIGSAHTEFEVSPEAAGLLPRLAWHYDEPFADSSAMPFFELARCARSHVTVALTGDGGDESFLGYERYRMLRVASAWRRLSFGALRRALGRTLKALGPPARNSILRAVRWLNDCASCEPRLAYAAMMTCFRAAERAALYTDGFAARLAPAAPEEEVARLMEAAGKGSAAAAAADRGHYLPSDLLVKADRAAFAHGLELRGPFLDRELVEFAAALPASVRLRRGRPKAVLRALAAERLGARVARAPKRGFGVPVSQWLRSTLAEHARTLLAGSRFVHGGYFRRKTVDRLLAEHAARREDHGARLWSLMSLETWARTFLGPGAPEGPPPAGAVG